MNAGQRIITGSGGPDHGMNGSGICRDIPRGEADTKKEKDTAEAGVGMPPVQDSRADEEEQAKLQEILGEPVEMPEGSFLDQETMKSISPREKNIINWASQSGGLPLYEFCVRFIITKGTSGARTGEG